MALWLLVFHFPWKDHSKSKSVSFGRSYVQNVQQHKFFVYSLYSACPFVSIYLCSTISTVSSSFSLFMVLF